MQKESLSKDLEGSFRDNIDNIVNKILFLESNPDIKNRLRLKSKDFVMDSFSVNKVGQMWSNFFFELSN
jgi:glycosyltransferase involved in cell wall biosynthesis